MSDEVVPRDVKIVHLILASMGVTSYQDHVPLQLMDFAYRYTLQVLQDALVYSDYASGQPGSAAGMSTGSGQLSVEDLKLAVSARVAYQFKPTTPKDLLMSLAAERNKRPLPPVPASYGLRLPPEKHCLTGHERDIDSDDDVVIAGYEKIDVSNIEGDDEGAGNGDTTVKSEAHESNSADQDSVPADTGDVGSNASNGEAGPEATRDGEDTMAEDDAAHAAEDVMES